MYLGGGGNEVLGIVIPLLATAASNPEPEPSSDKEEGGPPASDEDMSRKAVTSRCLTRYPGALSLLPLRMSMLEFEPNVSPNICISLDPVSQLPGSVELDSAFTYVCWNSLASTTSRDTRRTRPAPSLAALTVLVLLWRP